MLQESVGINRFQVQYDDMLNIDESKLLSGQLATKWDDPECKMIFVLFLSRILNIHNIHDIVCPVQVVGNLPFNVATDLLLKWLKQMPKREGVFQWGRVPFTLMFQKEVAEVCFFI
jgi:16S rRNA A1518/A1519 N6-dimethyltransferase RsmA/KsgA/DIM1 with predicted DNA glycosylase/AP lyase activity